MRPLELELKGFRSYRESTVFDFRGRRLVGVVGPIGSGKSSILDAVAFALYGKTPTFERDTKSLIHQLAETCHVRLRFEVDGEVWEATRALRRKGASGHDLRRLNDDDAGAAVMEQISGERPVRERVERLLGMAFDAFCRSVLLAQNRFAEFLHATPAQRNEVLKGVFGYERFEAARTVAKDREQLAQATLEGLSLAERELTQAREQLGEAEVTERETRVRAERLEAARPDLEAAAAEERAAEERTRRAEEETAVLTKAVSVLPDPDPVAAAQDEVAAADAAVAEAVDRVAAAEALRETAEATMRAAEERAGDQAFEALVQEQRAASDRVARATAALEDCRAAVAEAEAAHQTAVGAAEASAQASATADLALVEAAAGAAAAEAAFHDAQHADMARTLRADLQPGDPCPVCRRNVDAVPAVGRAPALASARKGLERGRAREAGARDEQRSLAERASGDLARVASAAERADEAAVRAHAAAAELTEADATLAAIKSELTDRLGEGDPEELLSARRREVDAARAALDAALEGVTAARDEKERAVELGTRGRRALAPIATAIAGAWGLLGAPRDVGTEHLLDDLEAVGTVIHERAEGARSDVAEAIAAREAARALTASMRADLGLAIDEDFTAALTRAATEAATARGVADRHRATIEAGAELDARIRDAHRQRELAHRLAQDLQPAGLLTSVLAAERAALAALGSVHLDELTGGGYRFTEDDRFDVLDMNAGGIVRRAASLSGGETFLASLALALALAEMVARGGGRLDAFFLDEGFGSLDPDHLERAMDGVGRLVAGDTGRLVVLVSHVEQMRQLLEDLIVLDKASPTGDTIVLSGAGLG
jgi:DNA repair protein SbcC/Rad50